MMTRSGFIALALTLLLPVAAMAQPAAVTSIGPRVGFSVDPDQFVFGGQLSVGPIAPSLMFVPSLELGFGDNRTVVAGNFDLDYQFAVRRSAWRPYIGAGMGINNETLNRPFADDITDTNVGGNIIFGATASTRRGTRFFSELRLGLGDIPSLKLLAGWNFNL